jgi:tubulin polyglutamylase TTLL5
MQEKFGKHFFNIIPDTYALPDEFADFYAHFHKLKNHDPKRNVWIVKPNALSRGRGIYLVEDISEINLDEPCVVCRYVQNPLLINGHKFDLRIYVLVTSFDPLRVYVYKEGLTRFATEAYSNNYSKGNKFVHLTNYSINKKNENFIENDNYEQDDTGFKWSLTALCKHLETIGIDMNLLWSRIYDVILKSLISGEHAIVNAIKKNCVHRNNCFELFGYDILLDSDLKPWLVEINLSPSLAVDSSLDFQIKSNLMSDTFNLIGVKKFDRRKESMNKMKNRMKGMQYRGKSYNP